MADVSAGALYFIRDELRGEFLDEVKQARVRVQEIFPNIFWGAQPLRLFWVLDYWLVDVVTFTSISDGAAKLRRLARGWAYAGGLNFRRGQLIAEAVRAKNPGRVTFPVIRETLLSAAFTLADKDHLYASLTPLKGRFAGGKIEFVENKSGPPSRAYLKLYEAFTLAGIYPTADEAILDLGATPGGWSYVVASLGARVTMIDRSRPDESLFRNFPEIKYVQGDGLNPADIYLEGATMVLSDMACEPAKLLGAVRRWQQYKQIRVMICTLKFHGLSDKAIVRDFAAIRGSEIYHLWHNGHELTWVWQRSAAN